MHGQFQVFVPRKLHAQFQVFVPRKLHAVFAKKQLTLYLPACLQGRAREKARDQWRQQAHDLFDAVRAKLAEGDTEGARALAKETPAQKAAAAEKARATLLALQARIATHIPETRLLASLPDALDPMFKPMAQDMRLIMLRGQRGELAQHAQLAADVAAPVSIGNTLRDLFTEWCAKKRSADSVRSYDRTVRRWEKVHPVPISARDITRDHCRAFLQANEGLGKAAQERHRVCLVSLFNTGRKVNMIDMNPAAGLPCAYEAVESDKHYDAAADGARSFTPEQIRTLLHHAPVHLDADCALALRVMIFSGLRGGECGQLRLDDVVTIDGVDCIHIRDRHPTQTVKNKYSVREVPLHDAIRADVLARKAAGGEWLFPSFDHSGPNTHPLRLREAFNGREGDGFLRGVCKIADPMLTLHSTRHRFTDACRKSKMHPDTERRICGHGKKDVHDGYGKGVDMVDRRKAINAVDPAR